MREYEKKESREDRIIRQEKIHELGYISPTDFGRLAGYWRTGKLFLRGIADILNHRLITRDDMIKMWRRNQGNLKGKLAEQIINRGLLHYIRFSEQEKRRLIKRKERENG